MPGSACQLIIHFFFLSGYMNQYISSKQCMCGICNYHKGAGSKGCSFRNTHCTRFLKENNSLQQCKSFNIK